MAHENQEEKVYDEEYDGMKGFADFEAKQKEEAEKEASGTSEDVTPNHVREAMEGEDEGEGEGDGGEETGASEDAGEEDGGEAGASAEDDASTDGGDEGAGEGSASEDEDDGETDETRGKADAELTEEQRERRRASRYQRKFGKERAAREKAERELEELRASRAQQPAPQQQQQQPQPQSREQERTDKEVLDLNGQPLKKPDPKEFEFDTLDPEYTSAVARYEGRKAFLEARAEAQEAEAQVAAEQQQLSTRSKFEKMIVDAEGQYDDFADKVVRNAENYQLTKELFELALDEPENGQHVLYHLATNPEEAERIAGLTPAKQGVEFDRLVSRFSQPNEEKSDPTQSAQTAATKRATKAAGPVKGVRGSGRANPTPSKQSFAEFEAAEMARQAQMNK